MPFKFGYKFSNFFSISNLSSTKSFLFDTCLTNFIRSHKRTEAMSISKGQSLLTRINRAVFLMRVSH